MILTVISMKRWSYEHNGAKCCQPYLCVTGWSAQQQNVCSTSGCFVTAIVSVLLWLDGYKEWFPVTSNALNITTYGRWNAIRQSMYIFSFITITRW